MAMLIRKTAWLIGKTSQTLALLTKPICENHRPNWKNSSAMQENLAPIYQDHGPLQGNLDPNNHNHKPIQETDEPNKEKDGFIQENNLTNPTNERPLCMI
jgi:hypothetical protein